MKIVIYFEPTFNYYYYKKEKSLVYLAHEASLSPANEPHARAPSTRGTGSYGKSPQPPEEHLKSTHQLLRTSSVGRHLICPPNVTFFFNLNLLNKIKNLHAAS